MTGHCAYAVRVGLLWRHVASPVSSQVPVAAAAALLTLAAGAADAAGAAPNTVVCLLATGQTAAVAWLALRSVSGRDGWASAGMILAGAWSFAFLVPEWIYVADPGLAAGLPLADAIAITTLALFAVICGNELVRVAWPPRPVLAAERVHVAPPTIARGRALAWISAGLTAMAVLFAVNGGPIEWITNLDKVGEMARGLTYLIGLVLVIKHVALVAICERLIRLRRLDRQTAVIVAAVALILLPLGARLFIAMLLVEVLVLHAILVRPVALRVLAPAGLACALLLIFGYGTVKRYETFRAAQPTLDRGFADYVEHRAVDEVGAAYANNYADGVRLTAQARSVVPSIVPFEHGKAFVRLALQPIPSPIRPSVKRDPRLDRFLGASGGGTHAVPLQAEGYVQFGLPGVLVLFLLLGAALAAVDRALARASLTLPALITLVVIAVQIPLVVRSGIPLGAAVAGLYVLGAYVVARTIVRTRYR
jgi:hypothetical protein